MNVARKQAWRNLFESSCVFAGSDILWADMAVNPAIDPDTCLCVIDKNQNLVVRIEHTDTNFVAASVSTRDEMAKDGRISKTGAWLHLTANITATYGQNSISKLIIANFLILTSLNALVSEIRTSIQAIVNSFLDTMDLEQP